MVNCIVGTSMPRLCIVVQWSVHWALSWTTRVLVLAGSRCCALETCREKKMWALLLGLAKSMYWQRSLHASEIKRCLCNWNSRTRIFGKISIQPHTIVKQICFPNGNVLFLPLFSPPKNWMHNVVWGCAEILPDILSPKTSQESFGLTTYNWLFTLQWTKNSVWKYIFVNNSCTFRYFTKLFLRHRDWPLWGLPYP